MIVVWGIDHGMCRPLAGEGFRQEFVTSQDADRFIKLQCNSIIREEIDNYAIYITDEFCSLDRIMHYHNWRGSNTNYQEKDSKIEEIDILEIKNHIDLEYQLYMRRQAEKKAKIDSEIKNMSKEELIKNAQMFKDSGLI